MTDPIREVRRGDRLRADDINQIGRRLNDLTTARPSIVAQAEIPGQAPNLLRVRNDAHMNLDRYSVVGIQSLDAPNASIQDGVLYAVAGTPTNTMPVVVTVEPIPAGQLGWVMSYGTTFVRVQIQDPNHRYARIIEYNHESLISAESGPFEMLQRESAHYAGESVRAFVRFPTATMVEDEGGFRMHDHRDNLQGGYSFSVYGTGAPMLAWD